MTKLDPTIKHLGTVLRRRLEDARFVETPRRIADLLERLSSAGQSDAANNAAKPVSTTN
jgi:hypothetical protein